MAEGSHFFLKKDKDTPPLSPSFFLKKKKKERKKKKPKARDYCIYERGGGCSC